jgi:hypothetical protein
LLAIAYGSAVRDGRTSVVFQIWADHKHKIDVVSIESTWI